MKAGNRMEIPVRNVTLDERKATLFGCIRAYEQSYRVSSAEMFRLLANGDVRETEELLKWMQSYRYAAWVEGGHPVLRYHNVHWNDDDYHHRVFNPLTGEETGYETLFRYQFPVFTEVLDELELITRVLEE